MTVAGSRHGAGSLGQRLKQIEPQVEALTLAARQLQLRTTDLCQFIEKKMGEDS
jgi:hypothetical protein